jgi:hypothetical protein
MNASTTRILLLILLVVASIAVLIGALAKVQQWPGANYFLVMGMVMELICGIGFVVVSLKNRNIKK